MRRVMFLGLFLSFFGLASCDVGDDDRQCLTGPVELFLEFVDEETDDNLYANDTFQQAAIEITDEDGIEVPYAFLRDSDRPILRLNLGMEEGERIITIQLDDEVSLEIDLALAIQDGNCEHYYISEFEVPGYEFDQGGFPGVVRILF